MFSILKFRPVKIVRLVGRNTVEEIILKRAEEKLKLTEKVIEEGEFSLGVSKQKLFTDDKVKVSYREGYRRRRVLIGSV